MSYLKSDFITLYGPRSPKISGSFYQPSDDASIKSIKPCFYNLKDFLNGNKSKTEKPYILFVNLLMKDGKKTHALRLLSMTLALFKARISKIKLEKHGASLKEPRKSYQYKFNPEFVFSKNRTAYSIKANNCSVFSRKKQSISKTRNIENPWLKRKVFPFISTFCFLLDEFYARKKFFCGKFINLKFKFKIKKNKEHYKTLSLLGLSKRKQIIFKTQPDNSFNRGDHTGISKALETIVFIVNPFRFKLEAKDENPTPVQRKNKKSYVSKGCVWYKTYGKKPSWDISAQKNSFLFCLYKAISNVKPPLECRTKRIGGSNKQIPCQVSEHRQWALAIRWIIEDARNEFSKRKNKSLEHKEIFRPHLHHSLENSGIVQDKYGFPRGVQSSISLVKENNSFISSLQQRKPRAPSKNYSPKTKFYYFCYFLAESLENAYYKRGWAMQKRNLWVDSALANRAFLRYRWW